MFVNGKIIPYVIGFKLLLKRRFEMANRSKKDTVFDAPKHRFQFSESFKRSFDATIGAYADALSELNKVSTGKSITAEYGVCACKYNLRYITPNDVSTYVSNLIKGLESGLFHDRIADVEMFTVASVKRFIEDNDCVPFESSSVLDDAHRYVNPKECTLRDLALISENDIGHVAVYSNGEMQKRLKFMADDIKRMNDMHFTANMKKIVSALPDVIEKGDTCILSNPSFRITFGTFLEEFLLFAVTLNTVAVLQLIGYGKPSVEYTVKPKEENSQDLVTECCLYNTNDFMIRNRIPFNCNMRDVVLQDVTPNFRDTHDALHFIMKDPRSPISVLVNKFSTKESNIHADCGTIARMFIGGKHHCHFDGDVKYRSGENVIGSVDPIHEAGMNTSVTWLDNIAFGNNYLDGNYRRDAVGNNHAHPITNSLDMVYKVFGGQDLNENGEIADHIVRVAGAMKQIICSYSEGEPIENYQITKDILVLLGEILTRSMLRLYYNNTRLFVYDDNMPDAMAPGFICMESFVMEADGQTQQGGNNTAIQQSGGNNAPKATVTFNNAQNQAVKATAGMRVSQAIQRFIQWINDAMSKFSDNFNKNHEKEVKWIKNNMKLNEEITEAIQQGKFTPNVANFPIFKIPAEKLAAIKIADQVKKYSDPKTNFDPNEFMAICVSSDQSIVNELKKVKDPGKLTEMWTNYILYSQLDAPKLYTGELSADQWKDLYTDLTQTQNLLSSIVKANSEDLRNASKSLQQQAQQLETAANNNESQEATAKRERINALNKCVQDIAKIYESTTLNVLNAKFYKTSYNMYRDIVAGYKQQNNSTQPQQQTTQQGQQPQTTNNNNADQPALDASSNAN